MITIAADLRNRMEPVRDQGRRPTCLAFAASATHRAAHNHPRALCAEWLYYHATRLDGLQPDQGSTIEATCAVIPSKGQPEEKFWPYQGQDSNPSPYRPPSAAPTVLRCDTGRRGEQMDCWRDALDTGCPVTIALFISSTFYAPARFAGSEAVMGDDTEPIDPALVHAVVLAGHGDFGGTPHFLIRNSWGLRWGWAGHAWFPENYLARRFVGAFVIQHGATDDVPSAATRTYNRLRVG